LGLDPFGFLEGFVLTAFAVPTRNSTYLKRMVNQINLQRVAMLTDFELVVMRKVTSFLNQQPRHQLCHPLFVEIYPTPEYCLLVLKEATEILQELPQVSSFQHYRRYRKVDTFKNEQRINPRPVSTLFGQHYHLGEGFCPKISVTGTLNDPITSSE
jgi:hypothetical protein